MQISILDSALRQTSIRLSDAPANSEALNHLPSLQKLECLLDLVMASVAFVIAYLALPTRYSLSTSAPSIRGLAAANIFIACLVVVLLDRSGAYRTSGGLLRVRETASVLQGVFFVFLMLLPLSLLTGNGEGERFLLLYIPLITILLVAEKQFMHSAFNNFRERGFGLQRVLIYGAGETAKSLFSALSRSPKLGLSPVAIIDDGSGLAGLAFHESCYRRKRSLVSSAGSFCASLIRSHRADVVFIASRPTSEACLQTIVEESKKAGVKAVFAANPAFGETGFADSLELDGQLVYSLHKPRVRLGHDVAPRVLDVIVSATILALIFPLLVLISVLIKIDSTGCVLFRQQRVGKNGRLFTIYKFRSMHTAFCIDDVSPGSSQDLRITRVGRFLRRTSLDELPQLINILRGEMALVGPRPEMPFIVAKYTERERARLAVRPGLTGLWQISADRCRPIHENIQYDLYYLRHRSIFMDFAILVHTMLFAMHGT